MKNPSSHKLIDTVIAATKLLIALDEKMEDPSLPEDARSDLLSQRRTVMSIVPTFLAERAA